MTGFGSAETESKKYRIKVEVKTLNSKFLDLSAKLPRNSGQGVGNQKYDYQLLKAREG